MNQGFGLAAVIMPVLKHSLNHVVRLCRKCAEAFMGQEWACFFAMYAWPHIRTPVFFHKMLYDRVGLQMLGADSEAKAELYRHAVGASMMARRADISRPPEKVGGYHIMEQFPHQLGSR